MCIRDRYLGTERFLCVYAASGVAGNVLSYAVGRSPLSVGASGAIFGLLGCWATFLAINSDFWAARGVRVSDSIALALAPRPSSSPSSLHSSLFSHPCLLSFSPSPLALTACPRPLPGG